MKNKLNTLSKSNVAYQFLCPACESSYIEKTERTMFERTKEHVTRANSAIKGHFDNFSNKEHLYFTHNLIMNDFNTHEFSLNLFR